MAIDITVQFTLEYFVLLRLNNRQIEVAYYAMNCFYLQVVHRSLSWIYYAHSNVFHSSTSSSRVVVLSPDFGSEVGQELSDRLEMDYLSSNFLGFVVF